MAREGEKGRLEERGDKDIFVCKRQVERVFPK
jgi:hypothetical protein